MAQTNDYQIAFVQRARVAAKALREAYNLAKDIDREWTARGATLQERQAWLEDNQKLVAETERKARARAASRALALARVSA